jgi:hypothetical protein
MSPSQWSLIEHSSDTSGDTASEAAYRRIRQWIYDCETNHEQCSSRGNAALPTRLLDLGQSNDSIKLVKTDGLSASYICLSHCWGESSTIMCTRETYSSYQNNIPWAILPPLFQDTVKICRRLGIQYLWIDKLCIIQHDENDWASEGSRMAQIFEGSFLTIAAAASKDDTDLLFVKDNIHFPSSKIHVGRTNSESPYVVCARIPFGYHPADKSSISVSHKVYPLLTRAWVYQERLLATRILYFGEELSWECRETSVCECLGANRGTKHDHSLTLFPGYPIEKLHLKWQEMIEEFTWLQLSHEEDRLPALSGLAQQYQRQLKSEYLAGLWKENLVADLMWYAYPSCGKDAQRYSTKRPRKWRAPSWSWASVEGPICFSRFCPTADMETSTESVIPWIEIVSAGCSASSLDPLGMVGKGQLVIKGRGRPAYLRHREKDAGHESRHFTVKHTGISSVYVRSNFTVDRQEAYVDYDLIGQGLMESNSDMSIYCLYLGGMSGTQRTFVREQNDYILRPVYKTWSLLLHSIDEGNFERVGFLVSECFDTGDQFRDSLPEYIMTIV